MDAEVVQEHPAVPFSGLGGVAFASGTSVKPNTATANRKTSFLMQLFPAPVSALYAPMMSAAMHRDALVEAFLSYFAKRTR